MVLLRETPSFGILVMLVFICHIHKASGQPERHKPPFVALYSNDTTNLEYLQSPFNEVGRPYEEEMLRSSVEEAVRAGADAILLQPGTGWIPWWKSDIESPIEHYQWWQETYGAPLSGYASYLEAGGDIVLDFVEACSTLEIASFISIRLNDNHGLQFADSTPSHIQRHISENPESAIYTQLLSRTYLTHPEYRFDAASTARNDGLWNWALPPAREHKLDLIRELITQYTFDGIELDFMRFPRFFDPETTPEEDRFRIMTDFVAQVREALDSSSTSSAKRYLAIRIPSQMEAHSVLGISLPDLFDVGVDMATLSSAYFTNQAHDMAHVAQIAPPHVAIYLEMTHVSGIVPAEGFPLFEQPVFIRTTDEQFLTTIASAYAAGADGFALFNFPYYRKPFGDRLLHGPFAEPPFHLIERLKKHSFPGEGSQHYFLGLTWAWGFSRRSLGQRLRGGASHQYELVLMPRTVVRGQGANLRIQYAGGNPEYSADVQFNGTRLTLAIEPASPLRSDYDGDVLHSALRLQAWRVPEELIHSGVNTLTVRNNGSAPLTMTYIDLIIR